MLLLDAMLRHGVAMPAVCVNPFICLLTDRRRDIRALASKAVLELKERHHRAYAHPVGSCGVMLTWHGIAEYLTPSTISAAIWESCTFQQSLFKSASALRK